MAKCKQKKIMLSVATILIAILITAGIYHRNPDIYYQEIKENSMELPAYDKLTMGDLVGKRDARQTFLSIQDTINSISVGVFSNERENDCQVTVELQDLSTNEICESWNFSGKRIPGSTYKLLKLKNPLKNTKGKMYQVRVYSEDASFGNAISVIADEGAEYEDGEFFLGGVKMTGAMMLEVTYANEETIVYKNKANLVRMGLMILIYLVLFELAIWQIGKFVRKCKNTLPAFWEKNVKQKKKWWKRFMLYTIISVIVAALLTVLLQSIVSGDIGWNGYYYLCLCGFAITGIIVYLICKLDKPKAEYIFLAIALITGIIYVMELPATTKPSWDDKVHYTNVQSLSHIVRNTVTKADYYMYYNVLPVTFDREVVKEYKEELNASYYGNENIESESVRSYTSVYQTLGYVPAAVVHMVGRFLHLPYVMIFYMGKLANLFLYVSVVYAAIKRLKSGKWILTTIALFPTLIYLASNYSYDYWVNAWTMYGFAYLFSVMEKKTNIEFKDFAKIVGSLFLGLGPKAIYFPFLLFFLFLPKECFFSKKQKNKYCIAAMVIMLVIVSSFMVSFIVKGPGRGDIRGGGGVNSTDQVQFILQNPLEYTKILLTFLFGDYLRIKNSNDYTNSMYYLGYSIFGTVSMFLLFVTMLWDHPKKKLFTWKHRAAGTVVFFGTVCLIASAIYVSFTAARLNTIVGCQPRYLLPILFPITFLLGYEKVTNYLSERFRIKKLIPLYGILQVVILYVSAFLCFVGRYT